MNKKPFTVSEDKTRPASITVGCVRNEKGDIHRLRIQEFKPGMVIKRCGKFYEADKNGVQRRVKTNLVSKHKPT